MWNELGIMALLRLVTLGAQGKWTNDLNQYLAGANCLYRSRQR